MIREAAAAALVVGIGAVASIAAQKKPAPLTKYDITITVDGKPYTGTMELGVAGGKVSGMMHITKPGEITGTPAGTTKAGQMKLDFPYHMVQNKCDGRIAMDLNVPAKGPAKGTVEINGCGSTKQPGTIELVPAAAAKPAPKK